MPPYAPPPQASEDLGRQTESLGRRLPGTEDSSPELPPQLIHQLGEATIKAFHQRRIVDLHGQGADGTPWARVAAAHRAIADEIDRCLADLSAMVELEAQAA